MDFLSYVMENVTMTATRKTAMKAAFAKQVGWIEKVEDPKDPEKEIDNPITFKEVFNQGVREYIRGTCVAGQQKLDKEKAEADDTFEDLIS